MQHRQDCLVWKEDLILGSRDDKHMAQVSVTVVNVQYYIESVAVQCIYMTLL